MRKEHLSRRPRLWGRAAGLAIVVGSLARADVAPRLEMTVSVIDSPHCPMDALRSAVNEAESKLYECGRLQRIGLKLRLQCSFDQTGTISSCTLTAKSGTPNKEQAACFRGALAGLQIPLSAWPEGSKPTACNAQVQIHTVMPPYRRPRPRNNSFFEIN